MEPQGGDMRPYAQVPRVAAFRRQSMANDKQATLYRMVLPDHICPFGVRAKQLLQAAGYTVDDQILRSRDEVDAYKAKEQVETTPQVFIDGERIGGADDLEAYLERVGAD